MHPKTLLKISKIIALLVAIALAYYVGIAVKADIGRSLVVALCIVFTCYSVVPYVIFRVGFEIHKWNHRRNQPNYSNLERL